MNIVEISQQFISIEKKMQEIGKNLHSKGRRKDCLCHKAEGCVLGCLQELGKNSKSI
jgi:hypothetical protein